MNAPLHPPAWPTRTNGGGPAMLAGERIPIAAVRLGDRHRKDVGDLQGLARSIAEVGLLHPIVLHPDGRLIAGMRRLEACKILGWTTIPCTRMDLESIVRGEAAENFHRKDFTWTEAVAIKGEIEPIEKALAEERMREGQERGRAARRGGAVDDGPVDPANLAGTKKYAKGEARDAVAKATGKKRTSLAKAEAVVKAAEEDPERFGAIAKAMDEDGNVDRAYKQVRIAKTREAYEARADKGANIGDLAAMAEAGQKFAVIYADPPWEYKTYSGKGKTRSAERYYDCSSLDAIKALPVEALAAKDSMLLLWFIWPELPGALEVIKAWGFEYKTLGFLWVKQNPSGEGDHTGLGYYTRSNSEGCLLATKGNPMRLAMDVHQIIHAPRGEHSAKPAEVRERIERLLAGPYLELFARRATPGWTSWGNELRRAP